MPGFNRRGPDGAGPGTGRMMGKCGPPKGTASEHPASKDTGFGTGRKRGKGQGQGMGRRQRQMRRRKEE